MVSSCTTMTENTFNSPTVSDAWKYRWNRRLGNFNLVFCALLLLVFLIQIGWLRYLVEVCGIIITHRKESTFVFLAQASSHSFFWAIVSGKDNAGIWWNQKGRSCLFCETHVLQMAPFKSPAFIWSPHLRSNQMADPINGPAGLWRQSTLKAVPCLFIHIACLLLCFAPWKMGNPLCLLCA